MTWDPWVKSALARSASWKSCSGLAQAGSLPGFQVTPVEWHLAEAAQPVQVVIAADVPFQLEIEHTSPAHLCGPLQFGTVHMCPACCDSKGAAKWGALSAE